MLYWYKLYLSMMKKFLLIGNGKMGSAFITPLRNDFDFTVVSPNSKPGFNAKYFTSVEGLTEKFDFITFAVKPSVIPQILEKLPPHCYDTHTRFISLAAGIKPHVFQTIIGEDKKIIIIMANLPVKIGKGILAIYSPEKLEFLEKLGVTVYVKSADEIDKYCALVGSGSGFCFNFLEMYQRAAENLQLDGEVNHREVVLSLFEGSLLLLRESGLSFEQQKNAVVTPNGTTYAGLQELKHCEEPIKNSLVKAYERAKELGCQNKN
jgi:pyrroline-5-carboxylate reductase